VREPIAFGALFALALLSGLVWAFSGWTEAGLVSCIAWLWLASLTDRNDPTQTDPGVRPDDWEAP